MDGPARTSWPNWPPRDGSGPDGFSASIGTAAWSGKFGAPTTSRIATVFINARYRTGDLRFDVTLPWMNIRSRGTILQGIDAVPLVVAPGIPMPAQRRRGFGDVSAGVSWLALHQEDHGVDLDLSARIKLPTSSDDTLLSTGKTDESFSLEVSRSFGSITPIGQIGYRVFGDPVAWGVRDGFFGSAGTAVALSGPTMVMLSYEYADRTSPYIRPSHALVAGVSAPIARRLAVNAFASAGLSSGAAGFATGASLKLNL